MLGGSTHHKGASNIVMQAASRWPEDEQGIGERRHLAHERDGVKKPKWEHAECDDTLKRWNLARRVNDLNADDAFANRLT